MTQRDKLRARIAAHDANLRFDQIHAHLIHLGATSRQTGSHVVYLLPGGTPVTIVKPHGGATHIKRHYVRNLNAQLTREGL